MEGGGTMEKIDIKATCPYCGHVNKIYFEMMRYYEPIVATCDALRGAQGCGKQFVIRTQVDIRTASYKIEGQ